MNKKLLITPVITPGGIPDESDLIESWMSWQVVIHGWEGAKTNVQLRDGAPEHFHDACRKLLASFSGKTDAILVGGTTGEGIGFWLRQWQVLMTAMKRACPPHIRIMAGLLGRDDMIQNQIRIAHELWIEEFVLGLNHTGDNQTRYDNIKAVFGSRERLWLYNMPTFEPASLDFLTRSAENLQVQGIKDSSKWTNALRLRMLLQLKVKHPDLLILAGNEQVYGELDDEEFAQIGGLVSGNSNADPKLLWAFTDEPRKFAEERRVMEQAMVAKSSLSGDNDAAKIQRHIHSIKLALMERGILEPQHVMLYNPRGKLFIPHVEPIEPKE
jgi:dihydrodipicolinate synthase/N-acetylneuraminate lyase